MDVRNGVSKAAMGSFFFPEGHEDAPGSRAIAAFLVAFCDFLS